MKRYDVIINGAGLVGSSIALALAKSGLQVLIIEYSELKKLYPTDDYGLRVSAFTPSSKKWLEYVDVWDALMHTGRVCPFMHMYVWDEAGDGALQFNAQEAHSDTLGWIIDNAATQGVLLDAVLASENITLLESTQLKSFVIHEGCIQVTAHDQNTYEAELLIGADGGRSQVRDWAGIPCTGWSYGQKTIVGQVRPERSHDNTCWQKFMKNGPVALLPLNDGRCSLAWHTTHEEADQLLMLPPEIMAHRLTEAFDGRFGHIEVCGSLGAYPLRLNHARAYVKEHFALVGDAAHSIHPLAGLGVNLGFLDAATLVEELVKAYGKESTLGSLFVLKRYERRRKLYNMAVMGSMDFFKKSSGADYFIAKQARNLSLIAANKLPFVKNKLARIAMGYYGDIPSFIKPK